VEIALVEDISSLVGIILGEGTVDNLEELKVDIDPEVDIIVLVEGIIQLVAFDNLVDINNLVKEHTLEVLDSLVVAFDIQLVEHLEVEDKNRQREVLSSLVASDIEEEVVLIHKLASYLAINKLVVIKSLQCLRLIGLLMVCILFQV